MIDTVIGRDYNGYRIINKLAEGGMGVVYMGEHLKLGRKAAIKVLKLEYCRDEAVVQRFYQEAQAVNAIHHEGIVDIYDFGRDPDGRVFYVMELLEGEPLSKRLSRGALSWREAVPIIGGTARALTAAHEKGFIHRDLKPDNIWLSYDPFDGSMKVKLLDFGIAKLVGMESPKDKLTRTGSIIGTPHYMAPEQINGSPNIDQRTDIYAFGIIIHEMLAGQPPFAGETLGAILMAHLLNDPPRMDRLRPEQEVPPWVPGVVARMMAKEPGGRPPTIKAAVAELEGGATEVGRPSIVMRAQRRRKWPYVVLGVTLLGGAGAAVVVGTMGGKKPVVTAPPPPVKPPPETPPDKPPPPTAPPDAAPVVVTPPPTPAAIDYEKLRADSQALLRATVRATEPAERAQGADALGEVRDAASVKALADLAAADPDAEVRGHAAGAVGLIGGDPSLRDGFKGLEKAAPAPLKVWLAEALLRLGDKGARKRLIEYAASKDLAISFKATLALADASAPGDKDAIKALTALAAREADLNAVAPYSGAIILTKLGRLRVEKARTLLTSALESSDERAKLAAAEGLARLGDDRGRAIAQEVLGNEASANRLVAATILLALGDYGGYPLMKTRLEDEDAGARRLAARALGQVGERESLPLLGTHLTDADPAVRIAAASALVSIMGLDPRLLARASVDWARSALSSEDWAVRQGAATLVGDVPEREAVGLLAQALADPQPEVRRAAATSAKRLRGNTAAKAVATAARKERDAATKEQLVRAMWTMKEPDTRPALTEIAAEPGRAGVLAAGALVALGDESAKGKVEAAAKDPSADVRRAAIDAAAEAGLMPTIVSVLGDTAFEVRFLAAETVARLKATTPEAIAVLKEGLASPDAGLRARATAALLKSGAALDDVTLPAAADLLGSPEVETRLSALTVVAALPPAEAMPLLRRALFDADAAVRRRALERLGDFATADRDGVTTLARVALRDPDDVVRAGAQAILAGLVEPFLPEGALVDVGAVQAAAAEATEAQADAAKAGQAVDACATAIDRASKGEPDDDVVDAVRKLANECEAGARSATAARARGANALARALASAGETPAGPAAEGLEIAKKGAAEADRIATAAEAASESALRKARAFADSGEGDATTAIASAEASLAAGKLGDARKDLDKAAKLLKAAGKDASSLKYTYGEIFDRMAAREKDAGKRVELLRQAKAAYDEFSRKGGGARAAAAKERSQEIDGEIAELEGHSP